MFQRIVLAATVAALTACASVVDIPVESPAAALVPDPAVRYGRLENGMRYAILRNAKPTGASAIRLRLNVGSLHEGDDERGLAHLLEHMAFNGSAQIPEGELVPLLQREGLAFGADANAYTTPEQTVYAFDLRETDARKIDSTFFILREIASELTLSDAAIERERGVVGAEARLGQTPALETAQASMRFFFPGARFVDRLPIGDAETVASAPPGRVRDFYRKWYRPESALLIFVGDADAGEVEKAIVAKFSDWRAAGDPPPSPERGTVSSRGPTFGFRHQPGAATNLLIASIRPARNQPETPGSRLRAQLLKIGNNIVNERLGRLLAKGETALNWANVSVDTVYHVGEMEGLGVGTSPQAWRQALATAEQELRRAVRFGFTSAEVARQVTASQEDLEWGVRVADARLTAGYVLALMYADVTGRVFTHPRDELAQFEADWERITVAAVNAAFRQAWSSGPLVYVTSGAPLAGESRAVEQAYESSRQVPVVPPVDVPAATFAYEDFGPAGTIVGRDYDPALDATKLRFANGVRLNVRQTSNDADRVYIRVTVRGGAAMDLSKARGWREAFQADFLAGGLAAHDYLELERLKAGRMANFGSALVPDGIALTGEASERALRFQLQALCAYLTAPAFRPGPMEIFRRQTRESYDVARTTALGALYRDFWGIISSGNPWVTSPGKDELLGWDSARLREVVMPMLEKGAIEIGIVGSAPVEDMIAAVARTFGALPARPALPAEGIDRRVSFAAPSSQPVVIRHQGAASQAAVAVYWPTADDSDPRRNAILSLMASVLQQRLIERIREQESASYAPSAGHYASHTFPGFGYFTIAVDTSPDKSDRVTQLIDEVIASVKEGVSQDEIDRVRKVRLQRFRESLEDDLSLMEPIAVAQSEPDTARAWLERPATYKSVSASDISAAAARYLRGDTAIRILVLPSRSPQMSDHIRTL